MLLLEQRDTGYGLFFDCRVKPSVRKCGALRCCLSVGSSFFRAFSWHGSCTLAAQSLNTMRYLDVSLALDHVVSDARFIFLPYLLLAWTVSLVLDGEVG